MSRSSRRSHASAAILAALLFLLGGCSESGTEVVTVTAVVVTAPPTTLEAGETLQLTAQVQPAAAPQGVTWSSGDQATATVSSSGLVTAVAPGPVTITAISTAEPSVSGAAALTVTGCVTLESGDVSDGAILPEGTCYEVHASLGVGDGTLVIEEGVEIGFGPNGDLRITSGGRLNAVGTASAPILFTSLDAAGTWRGILFDGSRSAENVLEHVIIENGGSSGWSGLAYSTSAVLLDDALVEIRNSTITGSGGQGITVYGGSEMVFEDNTLSENAVAAWVHPDAAGFIGSNTVFEGNTENVVRVVFENTNDVTTAQTWQALDVPYEIQNRFSIEAALSIEPGTALHFTADASVIVQNGGSLRAEGIPPTSAILLGSVEPGVVRWKGLKIETASADNVFDYVIFADGGSESWTGNPDSRAMVYLEGDSKAVFSNSEFRGSAHYALWVPGGGDITGFEDNFFHDNARAMIVHPDRAGAIAADNLFHDSNTENRVRVSFDNTNTLETAQTWNDFGTPFLVAVRTRIRGPLTIAAGTEVEFAQDASLVVGDGGSLRAAGTDDASVTFRGAEDLTGYWKGIEYQTASNDNVLEHVTIRNGGSSAWHGGPNGTGSLYISPNGFATLADVVFRSSGGYAVTIRGDIECTNVDDGGFLIWDAASGTAGSTCPP